MFGVKPHTSHFQPWGCVAFSKIQVKRKDHTSRGELCLFMGYNDRYHVGYRLYNIREKYFMKNKDDVKDVAKQWINTYIRPLRAAYPNLGMIFVSTDNGEFNSKDIYEFLLRHGVYSMLTCLLYTSDAADE